MVLASWIKVPKEANEVSGFVNAFINTSKSPSRTLDLLQLQAKKKKKKKKQTKTFFFSKKKNLTMVSAFSQIPRVRLVE